MLLSVNILKYNLLLFNDKFTSSLKIYFLTFTLGLIFWNICIYPYFFIVTSFLLCHWLVPGVEKNLNGYDKVCLLCFASIDFFNYCFCRPNRTWIYYSEAET